MRRIGLIAAAGAALAALAPGASIVAQEGPVRKRKDRFGIRDRSDNSFLPKKGKKVGRDLNEFKLKGIRP